MAGLINTAVSGLKLSQLQLAITGQNIVNANTEGYSRQMVTAETAPTNFNGAGYVSNGVIVSEIFRNTQQFLIDQLSSDISVLGEFEQYLTNISQMDNLLADPSTSPAAAMDDFFAALNGVANNPTGVESRQLLLSQTRLLVDRFKAAESKLVTQNQSINTQLATYARNITNIANQIGELNLAISSSSGIASGNLPNELLDSRDTLINKLARIVDVSTTIDSQLSMSVFIGEGQTLVIGSKTNELVALPGVLDPSHTDLAFINNGSGQVVTDQLSGGELGGIIRFRKEALEPALNSLGRIALAFTDVVNQQQSLGIDLEGNLGVNVFTDINAPLLVADRVRANVNNALPKDRAISVTIDDLSELTTSDYKVVFQGPGRHFSILRLQDNALMEQGILNNKLPNSVTLDGITINFESGSFQEGDSFLIQPTRASIRNMGVVINRPEAFAMGSPLHVDTLAGNQGSAYVVSAQATDVTTSSFTSQPGQLSPPIVIRFTSASTYDVLDFTDPANPVALQPPLSNRTFVPGITNPVFPEDPGGTTVVTALANSGLAQLSQLNNGYVEETISVTHFDADTGFVNETRIKTERNQSARLLAQQLSAIEGVHATASSRLQLHSFTSDGADPPLKVILNGVDLTGFEMLQGRTLPDPVSADFLRDSIMASGVLEALGIRATSDGERLSVVSSTGVDLVVEVEGNGGDSLQLRDGDLRTIVGRNDLSGGYNAAVNSSFDVDLGSGPVTVSFTPGPVNYDMVETTLQRDIDRALGAGTVQVSRSANGSIVLESVDRTRKLTVSNVSSDDVLGITPLVISGPDLGDQPAILGGGVAAWSPFDFSTVNGSFTLSVDGIYSDSITLNQNYGLNSSAAIVSAINAQIAASNGPAGLAGEVLASIAADGSVQFDSTGLGPAASLDITAATDMQNLVINGSAAGSQLTGTQALVSGAMDINSGADFNQNGPHNFTLAVDGNPPLFIDLVGTTGIPARFTNTLDVSVGVNLLAVPNTFELMVAGQPTAVIDVSGVDTTLAPNPYSAAPQGIVDLFQERIDAQLGANILSVGLDVANRLTLTTVLEGASTSVTVANPTGDVATDVFPVVGTSVGAELGGPGVLNILRTAINQSLATAGIDPVTVAMDDNGFLTISSPSYGSNSQISIGDVNGGYGIIFPGSADGVNFTNSATVGGTVDVQLAADITLNSNRVNGVFGQDPEAINNFSGYQVVLNIGPGGSGLPVAGDSFLIDFNRDGKSDNSNAIAMLKLSNERMLSKGNIHLRGAYNQVVEEIGILTSQSRLSQQAGETLLQQSQGALQSVAGVNLEEEAANLIRFEQHYNASAQLISIARDMFNVLLDL